MMRPLAFAWLCAAVAGCVVAAFAVDERWESLKARACLPPGVR